jgi:RNA polymerase sigma factor (sigma-70 family)
MSNTDGPPSEHDTIKYLCDISSKYKLLTREEERHWLTLAHGEDEAAKKQAYHVLISRNLRLAIKISKRFTNRGLPLEDLVQEATLGIIRAIEKFELGKGTKFSTYATRWIEQKVRRALENKSRVVRIPGSKLAKITTLKKAYKEFIENVNMPPSSAEIADILEITKKEAEELGRLLYSHVSLDQTTGEDDNLSMLSYVVDESITPEEKVESFGDKVYVQNLISFLSKEDADFIKLKFGFLDNKERTNKEMSQLMQLSLKEVKDRETRILQRLQEIAEYESVNYEL